MHNLLILWTVLTSIAILLLIRIIYVNYRRSIHLFFINKKSPVQTDFKYKIYNDVNNEWRWRLVSNWNGNVIADSGEGYKNKQDCKAMIDRINGHTYPIVIL